MTRGTARPRSPRSSSTTAPIRCGARSATSTPIQRRRWTDRRTQMFTAFYAAIYDRISSGSERAGLGEERRRLLAQADGVTIEIGAGTGVNLAHYPPTVRG